jgi:formyl-CoA transferase
VIEAEHPVYGRYRRVRGAAKFSKTIAEASSAPALYGEHTEAILEELGYSNEVRDRLRSDGIVP